MLDFQTWPDRYKARTTHGTLDELVEAGERLARRLPFSPELDDALTYGSAVGGARPKALLVDGDRELIAKFSVSTDTFPWVQAEAIAMELARRCGVITAATTLTSVKTPKLPETRLRFDVPAATLCQLFRRFVVSILVGNTDDHPRNHAAFWDGRILTLTPAFDICPQPRATGEATQVMAFGADGERRSRLAACVVGAGVFQLSAHEASSIVDERATVVQEQYDDACTQVGVSDATRSLLWGRAIANKSVFYPLDQSWLAPGGRAPTTSAASLEVAAAAPAAPRMLQATSGSVAGTWERRPLLPGLLALSLADDPTGWISTRTDRTTDHGPRTRECL